MKWFEYLTISVVCLGTLVGPVACLSQSPATEAFTFVQICDPQLGWGYGYDNDVNSLKKAVSHINGLQPDFAVLCGDMVDNFNDTSVADFKAVISELTVPCYWVPGNHDVGESGSLSRLLRYRQALGEDFFSFEHKGYTFVFVNTSLWKLYIEGESEKQDAWFKQTLAAAREKHSPVFVVQHFPLYVKDLNEAEDAWNLSPAKRRELLTLFEDSGVVAVLSGHRHLVVINDYKGIALVTGETTCRHFDDSPTGFRLWQVESPVSMTHEFRPLVPDEPTVDFNGDEVVDSADMCILVDHWKENYAACDVAPPPFGDGVVDIQDLTFLAEHLFDDYRLTAHWRLDETDGAMAYDSLGLYPGIVHGSPTWQPAEGRIDGSLQFNGTEDYISTPPILDPAETPFSVYAWIKGGAPGQVVISQTGSPWGANWLCADDSDGCLKTDLKGTNRWDRPLVSQSIITDGNWHHIGLVWDGANRTLYVDEVAVMTDTQKVLGPSPNSLHIGAANHLDTGRFWSGLIDNVRLYDRVVTP